MKYAIIAAGEGSRLASEGVEKPKPLVCINGEPLIDRLIRIFMDNRAEEIIVICNDHTTLVRRHLEQVQREGLNGRQVPLRLVVKSTPSSMHSMFEISRFLKDTPFCLTTVDTIFREQEFAEYISYLETMMKTGSADGLMAVTDYIDDEKPLYISTDADLRITGFHDTQNGCTLISGGIYGLSPKSIQTLERCMERKESRMRNFQRALIADGMNLAAYKFSKILDIDHKEDIEKAEDFLKDGTRKTKYFLKKQKCCAIYRARRFSPNSVDRDDAIMDAVCRELAPYYEIERLHEEELEEASSAILADATLLLTMARSKTVLQKLKKAEDSGKAVVVNNPSSLLQMTRSGIDAVMRHNNIPCAPLYGKDGWWIKRGDETAQDKNDVVFAADDVEKERIIEDFWKRGISDLVTTAHVAGDLVKYYGVAGTGFFHTSYPTDGGFSKFGDERQNGTAHHTPLDKERLQTDAERLAMLTGIEIYGGDCIVAPSGEYSIIDFNDWPSFAVCRNEAAKAIARYIIQKNKEK
jgi:NDP-sugar pyrophosphorylase family protein